MKRFIVVRHGECDSSGTPTTEGRNKIHELVDRMRLRLKDMTRLVVSSPAPCAKESARLLLQEMGRDYNIPTYTELLCDDQHDLDLQGAVKLIHRLRSINVLILVTTVEYAGNLPMFYAHTEFGQKYRPGYISVGLGEAVEVDIEFGRINPYV